MCVASLVNSTDMQWQPDTCSYDEAYPHLQLVLRVYIALPVLLLGVLGNIFNVVVFLDHQMRLSPVNRCLLCLSVSDLLLLSCSIVFLPLPVLAELTDSLPFMQVVARMVLYSFPSSQVAATWSVYFTVVVSVYQCVLLRHRFFATQWITMSLIDMLLIGVLLFGYLFNVNRFFELTIRPCYSYKYRVGAWQIGQSELMHSENYMLVYHVYLTAAVLVVTPVAILIPVNISIVRFLSAARRVRLPLLLINQLVVGPLDQSNQVGDYLRKNSLTRNAAAKKKKPTGGRTLRRRKKKKKDSREERTEVIKEQEEAAMNDRDFGVTVMLLGVVSMFLTCNLLTFASNIVEILAQYYEFVDRLYRSSSFTLMVDIGNLMVLINSSSTFVIYVAFNPKFRKAVVRRLRFLRRRKFKESDRAFERRRM